MINLTLEEKEQWGNILANLADSIDLTEAQYKLAIERYQTIGKYLSDENSLLAWMKPNIKLQGSLRIGTPVRPVHEECEFDVDLTCLLQAKLPINQSELKSLVGRQLKKEKPYKDMLEEMRRCWRLKYAETSKFHMDIVPAIPDEYGWLLAQGVPSKYAQHAINITDNERANYEVESSDLPKSNTEGYALWFLDIMELEARQVRLNLKDSLSLRSIDEVPDYKVRTQLQRGIQLMKRHRDSMFEGKDDAPISIIITTLAARSYEYVIKNKSATTFYDTLVMMVEAMLLFIEKRNDGKWIPNPVNPKENFADKWKSKKEKEVNFFRWHTEFLNMLRSDRIKKGMKEVGDLLKENFGTRAVNEALNKIGDAARVEREAGRLRVASSGILGAVGTAVKSHTFHGSE